MPTGRNADHIFGPNAERAECRRAECRPQPLALGRNADFEETNQTNQVKSPNKKGEFRL